MSRPIILALDSSGLGCSVAVAVGGIVLQIERSGDMHGQAEALMPLVDAAMRKAALLPAELDLMVATVGPGSFTGIRVGLAAARGISLATGVPLVGVTSFAAVAASLASSGDISCAVLVALESRREDIYIQFFDRLASPAAKPAALMPDELCAAANEVIGAAPLLVGGDAVQRVAPVLAGRPDTTFVEDSAPDAIGAFRAALHLRQLGRHDLAPRPLYLRPPDVTLSGARRKP